MSPVPADYVLADRAGISKFDPQAPGSEESPAARTGFEQTVWIVRTCPITPPNARR